MAEDLWVFFCRNHYSCKKISSLPHLWITHDITLYTLTRFYKTQRLCLQNIPSLSITTHLISLDLALSFLSRSWLCLLTWDMGEAVEIMFGTGFPEIHKDTSPNQTLHSNQQDCHWYEETIDDDLKWSFALNRFSSFFCPNFAYPLILFFFFTS